MGAWLCDTAVGRAPPVALGPEVFASAGFAFPFLSERRVSTLSSEPDWENSSASSNGLFNTDWLLDCSFSLDNICFAAPNNFASSGTFDTGFASFLGKAIALWSMDILTSTASSYLSLRNLRSLSVDFWTQMSMSMKRRHKLRWLLYKRTIKKNTLSRPSKLSAIERSWLSS